MIWSNVHLSDQVLTDASQLDSCIGQGPDQFVVEARLSSAVMGQFILSATLVVFTLIPVVLLKTKLTFNLNKGIFLFTTHNRIGVSIQLMIGAIFISNSLNLLTLNLS